MALHPLTYFPDWSLSLWLLWVTSQKIWVQLYKWQLWHGRVMSSWRRICAESLVEAEAGLLNEMMTDRKSRRQVWQPELSLSFYCKLEVTRGSRQVEEWIDGMGGGAGECVGKEAPDSSYSSVVLWGFWTSSATVSITWNCKKSTVSPLAVIFFSVEALRFKLVWRYFQINFF